MNSEQNDIGQVFSGQSGIVAGYSPDKLELWQDFFFILAINIVSQTLHTYLPASEYALLAAYSYTLLYCDKINAIVKCFFLKG